MYTLETYYTEKEFDKQDRYRTSIVQPSLEIDVYHCNGVLDNSF